MVRREARSLYPLIAWMSLLAIILTPTVGWAQGTRELTLNYIEAIPIPEKSSFEVRAYVTASDSAGMPIMGLGKEDFKAFQDGKEVPIDDVSIATEGMAIVLVLDTSGSMAFQGKWDAARAAAVDFLDRAKAPSGQPPTNQASILSFNSTVIPAPGKCGDFTEDLNACINAINVEIGVVEKSNTCLYDAAYKAVEKAAEIPRGRRAVILLTDGIDEVLNQPGPCSVKTIDDAITRAQELGVPIHAVGLGDRIDPQALGRMADLTGGRRWLAPEASDLAKIYQTIATQLKNQYVIRYTSNDVSGEHTLVIKAQAYGLQDAKRFNAPLVPPTIRILTPAREQEVSGKAPVRFAITSQGNVAKVEYFVDDQWQGEDTTPPFEFDWDTAPFPEGFHSLKAVVYDSQGATGEDEVIVSVFLPALPVETRTPSPPPLPSPTPSPTPTPPPKGVPFSGAYLLVPLLGLAGLGAFMFVRRSRRQPEWSEEEVLEPGPEDIETRDVSDEVPTEDISASMLSPIATLTVVRSLGLPPGETFELYARSVRIGRGRDNDWVIPDQPVSREHARIEFEAGAFCIYDLDSRYGTRVGHTLVPPEGMRLGDGDQIKLGTQTVVEFRQLRAEEELMGVETQDIADLEETRDVGKVVDTQEMGEDTDVEM